VGEERVEAWQEGETATVELVQGVVDWEVRREQ
jgi:phage host-nuclease inhibitor protein Gam